MMMKDMDGSKPAPPRRYNTRFGGIPHSIIKYKGDGTRSDGTRIYNKSSLPNGLCNSRRHSRQNSVSSSTENSATKSLHSATNAVRHTENKVQPSNALQPLTGAVQPTANGIQPPTKSQPAANGVQPVSDRIQPTADVVHPAAAADGIHPTAAADGIHPTAAADGIHPAAADGAHPAAAAGGTCPAAATADRVHPAAADGVHPAAATTDGVQPAAADGIQPATYVVEQTKNAVLPTNAAQQTTNIIHLSANVGHTTTNASHSTTNTIHPITITLHPATSAGFSSSNIVTSVSTTLHPTTVTLHPATSTGHQTINTAQQNVSIDSTIKNGGWTHHSSVLTSCVNSTTTSTVQSVNSNNSNSNNNNVRRAGWILPKQRLSWDNSPVASYNPKTKMFRCIVCQAVGFMSRIAEHYLGTHCNAKVFQCPQCTYCSAWWRCVRNHMSKHHGVHNAPASMWKSQPLLDEILQMLQNLKYSVDCQDREEKVAENSDKRYICPKCPYATDRRDLYNRHENIHREEKPFQCYVCFKLFNRADHVKKHFYRIHKEHEYDINLIRRLPSKRNRIPVSASINGFGFTINPHNSQHINNELSLFPSVVNNYSTSQAALFRVLESQLKEDRSASSFKSELSNSTASATPLLSSYLESRSTIANKSSSDLISTLLSSPSSSLIWKQKQQQQKAFQCVYCPWKGVDGWCLRRHLNTHLKPFSCSLCEYKSSRGERLETHLLNVHGKHLCNKCSFLADSDVILDAHLKEIHGMKEKERVKCKFCTAGFESLSDLEAHCFFIHSQSLLRCNQEGCGFSTMDPSLLECHHKEKHPGIFQGPVDDSVYSSWDTLCLYCGCDFANVPSLQTHLELFHENPLQLSIPRQQNPYRCTVCGYTTPTQRMMMEHMRIHTGQILQCEAGNCLFRTPYNSVLREHVLQMHTEDEGIVRCLHCGYPCSTRYSFASHYQVHHPVACYMCREVEYKHFLYFDNSAASGTHLESASIIPSTNDIASSEINGNNIASRQFSFNNAPIVTPISTQSTSALRRSRKQSQPRKIVQPKFGRESGGADKCFTQYPLKSISNARIESFPAFYIEKARKLSRAPLLRCRYCYKRPLYFRQKRNLFLHVEWYHTKFYPCHKCSAHFHHRYQVVLHNRREHREEHNS